MSKMFVWIVWDHDREEHGESPELLGLFRSEQTAHRYADGSKCPAESVSIEKREVK